MGSMSTHPPSGKPTRAHAGEPDHSLFEDPGAEAPRYNLECTNLRTRGEKSCLSVGYAPAAPDGHLLLQGNDLKGEPHDWITAFLAHLKGHRERVIEGRWIARPCDSLDGEAGARQVAAASGRGTRLQWQRTMLVNRRCWTLMGSRSLWCRAQVA